MKPDLVPWKDKFSKYPARLNKINGTWGEYLIHGKSENITIIL